MPGRNFLFVPGPTNVPERVLRAMDRAMEDHRSSAFPDLATGLFRDLTQDRQHEIKGVLIVHNETATGVTSDLGAVRRAIDAAQHPALLYVDGVSSVGSIDFRMDEWKVDLAITGSQKGLMLPAGLGIVC